MNILRMLKGSDQSKYDTYGSMVVIIASLKLAHWPIEL